MNLHMNTHLQSNLLHKRIPLEFWKEMNEDPLADTDSEAKKHTLQTFLGL